MSHHDKNTFSGKLTSCKDTQSPCWIQFQRTLSPPQLRSRGVAASLCLNRDESSGPGNLALIQLLLQAKLLIPSSARVRSSWPQSPGDNGNLEHKMWIQNLAQSTKKTKNNGKQRWGQLLWDGTLGSTGWIWL